MPPASARSVAPRWLDRLGLGRPELRAWALYDVANSAAVTSIVTAVFPIYFASVAAAGLPPVQATQLLARTNTVALAIVAMLAPVLGSLVDVRPWKKRILAAFVALGAASSAALFLVGRGDVTLALVIFVLMGIGLNGSFVAYDALLPHVARPSELDRVSAAGYALGYLGGGILLAAQLAVILEPGLVGLASSDPTLPSRIAFLSVAAWWTLFTLPLLRRVPEPPVERPRTAPPTLRSFAWEPFARAARTFASLARHRNALRMLLAFLLYNDGIGTIIRMAAIYGTEIGLGRGTLIGAILLVQFLGIPFAFLFGALGSRVGAKPLLLAGLGVYTLIAVLAYGTRTATHFWILAAMVAVVQGGCQALSRSLFASLVPRHVSGEFFGFYAVSEKFAGIFGPLLFALAAQLTGSSRAAILSVVVFFVAGAVLLAQVDVAAGQREAREAEDAGR